MNCTFKKKVRPAGFEPQVTPFLHLAEEAGQWLAERVNRALLHYRRDVLWDQMLAGSAALGNAGVSADELSELLSLAAVSSLEKSDDALRGLFSLPFTWAGIVDSILATFGQNTRFIPMAVHAGGGDDGGAGAGSGGSSGGEGEIIQVIVFDAQCTDVAAHLYYNPQTSRLKADIVRRQTAAVASAASSQQTGSSSGGGGSTDDGGGAGGGNDDAYGGDGDDDDEVEESEQVLAERRHMAAVVNMICCNLWGNL